MSSSYLRMMNYAIVTLLLAFVMGKDMNAQCFSIIPYPIGDPCVQIVIANDPYCCNNTWDFACQTAYDDCNVGGGCTAVAPYPDSDPCYLEVISNDTYCCNISWDGACQAAYDMCDPGGGGSGTPIDVSSTTYTIPELIDDVLLGSCVEASNITSTGADGAFGNFSGGSDIGFPEG